LHIARGVSDYQNYNPRSRDSSVGVATGLLADTADAMYLIPDGPPALATSY